VRVQWTREDDVRHGYYHASTERSRPASTPTTSSSPGASASLAFDRSTFDTKSTAFGLGCSAQRPAAQRRGRAAESCAAPAHVRIEWLAVYDINHCFSVQSLIGELAAASGRDPSRRCSTCSASRQSRLRRSA
jgi:isoquinoline 1-oxidoreductase beta subunit